MKTYTTPNGVEIDGITFILFQSEILLATGERLEAEPILKMMDIILELKNLQNIS